MRRTEQLINVIRPYACLNIRRGIDNKACPRCGGVVFEAEKTTSPKGYAFHIKCLTCKVCCKRLDAGSVCVGAGTDPEIYCKGCYCRLYGGGTGYRGGNLSEQWIDDQVR